MSTSLVDAPATSGRQNCCVLTHCVNFILTQLTHLSGEVAAPKTGVESFAARCSKTSGS
jgi:hypothetical protein